MTSEEAKAIAKAAATEAVHGAFQRLGVDEDDWTEVQRDMAFIRSWRQSSDAVKRQGLLTAIGIIVAGGLGLIWLAVKGSP